MFESCIDVFSVSACGHFLAAGLRDGSAQLVHVNSRRILASFPLVEPKNDACFSAAFFQATGAGGDRLCVLGQDSGQLFVFENLGLAGLEVWLQEGDLGALVAAKDRLTQSQVSAPVSFLYVVCCD